MPFFQVMSCSAISKYLLSTHRVSDHVAEFSDTITHYPGEAATVNLDEDVEAQVDGLPCVTQLGSSGGGRIGTQGF